jgi:hypothetical protein
MYKKFFSKHLDATFLDQTGFTAELRFLLTAGCCVFVVYT